jgi:hypothetical protein
LVSAYYQTVGWPTFLPTAEQAMFAGKVRRQMHAASGSAAAEDDVCRKGA